MEIVISNYSVILKYIPKDNDILLDIDLTLEEIGEYEVVLKPGIYNVEIIYIRNRLDDLLKCKEMYKNKKNHIYISFINLSKNYEIFYYSYNKDEIEIDQKNSDIDDELKIIKIFSVDNNEKPIYLLYNGDIKFYKYSYNKPNSKAKAKVIELFTKEEKELKINADKYIKEDNESNINENNELNDESDEY